MNKKVLLDSDNIIYSDNGVEIDFYIRDSIITTSQYSIYWNVNGEFEAYELAENKSILEMNKPYDLSLFATVDETNGNTPPIILYSSAKMVDARVKSMLKLKAFL
jgi:hypothetical protein